MSTTPNLVLNYISSSQAQKEVTHNDALNDLDFLVQPSVIDHAPGSPATGDAYIIAASRAVYPLTASQISAGNNIGIELSGSNAVPLLWVKIQ